MCDIVAKENVEKFKFCWYSMINRMQLQANSLWQWGRKGRVGIVAGVGPHAKDRLVKRRDAAIVLLMSLLHVIVKRWKTFFKTRTIAIARVVFVTFPARLHMQ